MKRVLAALVLLLGLPLWVWACLWDIDTPADEANGLPEVVAVLTARFAINPRLYYELRLGRVTAGLRTHPDDLGAYDDAGVACDRMGRGDEAVAWMEQKRARLDQLDAAQPDVKEQWYRYHANLGTFLAHRWMRQGANRTNIDAMKAAREQIARALELNPNAHFGREKYQLRAIEWIINPPPARDTEYLPDLLGWGPIGYGQTVDPKLADEAVRGLSGLIVLGNAWQSVDIVHALEVALQHDTLGFERGLVGGRNTLAYFAWLRCRELIDAGKGSMLPDAPTGEDLKDLLPRPHFVMKDNVLEPSFVKLRSEAESWRAVRTTFMMNRLQESHHPDTDRDFWNGYTEPPVPSLPAQSVPDLYHARQRMRERWNLLVVIGVSCLAVALAGGLWAILGSRKGRRLTRESLR